jgi:hypothetical protein
MRRLVTVCLVLLMAAPNAQPKTHATKVSFWAEDEGPGNVKTIPAPVLKILSVDEDVRLIASNESISTDALPRSWFVVYEANLGDGASRSLVIIGIGPLSGANSGPFWVFHRHENDWELVFTDSGLDLRIGQRKTHRLRELELSEITAVAWTTRYFVFDGKKYVYSREEHGNLGNDVPEKK